jgi:hypothetical protein
MVGKPLQPLLHRRANPVRDRIRPGACPLFPTGYYEPALRNLVVSGRS